MKIDIFNHIFPKIFYDKMVEVAPNHKNIGKRVRGVPVIVDLEARFRMMDQFDDYVQVICLPNPPLEVLGAPEISSKLAKVANDGMVDYVAKYPDRFPEPYAALNFSVSTKFCSHPIARLIRKKVPDISGRPSKSSKKLPIQNKS